MASAGNFHMLPYETFQPHKMLSAAVRPTQVPHYFLRSGDLGSPTPVRHLASRSQEKRRFGLLQF
jgi:hypothetical protein